MTPPASKTSAAIARSRQNAWKRVAAHLRNYDNYGIVRTYDNLEPPLPRNDEEHQAVVEDIIRNERLMELLVDRHQHDTQKRLQERKKVQKSKAAPHTKTNKGKKNVAKTVQMSKPSPVSGGLTTKNNTENGVGETAQPVQIHNIRTDYLACIADADADAIKAAATLCHLVKADGGMLSLTASVPSSAQETGDGG